VGSASGFNFLATESLPLTQAAMSLPRKGGSSLAQAAVSRLSQSGADAPVGNRENSLLLLLLLLLLLKFV